MIKKYISIERSVHAVMVAFAAASVGNITSYFLLTNHHIIVAILMAVALGTAVATVAIMLTKIDMVKQLRRYIAVGAMVLCLVFVSGFVQMQNYLNHGLSLAVSASMGFGIVFSGECLTAIALSLYRASERARVRDEADAGLEDKLAQTFAAVLDSIDTTKSVPYMQRHIDSIIRHKADELVSLYVPNDDAESMPITRVRHAESASKSVSNRDDRRQRMADWLITNYADSTIDDIPRIRIMEEFGIGRDTALSDLRAVWKSSGWNGYVAAK